MSDLLAVAGYSLRATAFEIDLAVQLPRGLASLLSRMLAGWRLTETEMSPDPALAVLPDGTGYRVTSFHYVSERRFGDLVSVLNEALVALAYAVRSQHPDDVLIHAAGLERDREALVVFGARKAGKSVFTARQAAAGARIFADDLLLWSPRDRQFTGLGIAPRLRRPILPDLLASLPDDALIVGEHTCYLRADRIDLAPAGAVLRPDRIAVLQPDRTLRDIGLLRIGAAIADHAIH